MPPIRKFRRFFGERLAESGQQLFAASTQPTAPRRFWQAVGALHGRHISLANLGVGIRSLFRNAVTPSRNPPATYWKLFGKFRLPVNRHDGDSPTEEAIYPATAPGFYRLHSPNRHEKFAHLVAKLVAQLEASIGACCSASGAHQQAHELLKNDSSATLLQDMTRKIIKNT